MACTRPDVSAASLRLPIADLRLEHGDLRSIERAVTQECCASRVRLGGVVATPVPAAGAVRVRARRLVVLAAGEAGELLDPVLERRLGALDRCDLRGGLLDLGLVEDGRGLAGGLLLERARLRQLLRDRRLEDELHHRQPEHEREHHGECGARDGQHEVRDPTRPEALVDQPVDDADDARPDDSEPQDVLERHVPPAAPCDRDGEARDHGHRRDDESLGVEEAPFARHERQNARVGAREPRPPQPGPARPARAGVRFVRLHQTFVARAVPETIDLNASIEPRAALPVGARRS